jgi:RNA-binding protein
MLTSKQRSFLRALGHKLDPIVFLGKGGLTENIIKELDTNLELRELIKVKLQDGCDLQPKDVAQEVSEKLKADVVQVIGHKFILYRESVENKEIVLPRSK